LLQARIALDLVLPLSLGGTFFALTTEAQAPPLPRTFKALINRTPYALSFGFLAQVAQVPLLLLESGESPLGQSPSKGGQSRWGMGSQRVG
jgi:hypothetical protein